MNAMFKKTLTAAVMAAVLGGGSVYASVASATEVVCKDSKGKLGGKVLVSYSYKRMDMIGKIPSLLLNVKTTGIPVKGYSIAWSVHYLQSSNLPVIRPIEIKYGPYSVIRTFETGPIRAQKLPTVTCKATTGLVVKPRE